MWFAKPGPPVSAPGSKNSGHVPPLVQSPLVHDGAAQLSVPVIVEVVEASPAHTDVADASAGGGGATSWTTRSDQLLAGVSAYSWKVQTVWSSFGSTSVCE